MSYYYDDDYSLEGIVSSIFLLYIIELFFKYFTDRSGFWHWLAYGILAITLLIGGLIYWRRLKEKRRFAYLEKIHKQIQNAGQEEYIKNFISRFGHEGKKGNGWPCRDYIFDWARINDLEKILLEKGVQLRTDKPRDIFIILKGFIDEREEKLTRESIVKEPQKFASLTGSDFEKLLYRLFEAMGYAVQLIGKSGDQGGDLVLNKSGERTLVQAKCYRDWATGNSAVQQVVAAMKFYDCSKAMVVTTTSFTPEAIALGKANSVTLVSKPELQKMLLENLKESWS